MLTVVSHVAGGWRAEHHLPCSHNLSWRPGHYWEGTTHCPPPTAIPTLFKDLQVKVEMEGEELSFIFVDTTDKSIWKFVVEI